MQISAGTGLHILNDSNENRKMLSKLPDWLVSHWGRIVAIWQEGNRGFPPFSEFRIFIVKEANIACNPVTSLQSLKGTQSNDSKESKSKKAQAASTFMSQTSMTAKDNGKTNNVAINKCLFLQ